MGMVNSPQLDSDKIIFNYSNYELSELRRTNMKGLNCKIIPKKVELFLLPSEF